MRDWSDMPFAWLPPDAMMLLRGLWLTIELTVLSGIIGNVLAVFVGFGRISRNWLVAMSCLAFTSVVRRTPLLLQIFLLYYGLGSAFAGRDGFWSMVAALSISTAGYSGEVMRAALLAVPRGEIEAGRAFGLSGLPLIRLIWLPRALHGALPMLAGETVRLLKSTALASTISVTDLLGAADAARGETLRAYQPLLFAAAVYFLLTMAIEHGFRRLERRYRAYRRA